MVGDVHGALGSLRTLLRRARLTDFEDDWLGDGAVLVLLGDLMDRGPDGLGVLRLVQRLEIQAREAGGQVISLLGNHEVMMLAALRFLGGRRVGGDPYGLYTYWKENGGRLRDLSQLEPADLEWLEARPAMHLHGDWLLLHADSRLYLRLGDSLSRVNELASAMLRARTPETWVEFLNAFAERELYTQGDGQQQATETLRVFGGHRLVHGHTPVFVLRGTPAGPLMSPHRYASGLVLGLDSAMAYQQGSGFMVRLDAVVGRLDRTEYSGVLETVYLSEQGVDVALAAAAPADRSGR